MEIVWFCLLFFMLATYVVLGGTDLGVGMVHLCVARGEHERWQVIRTIRPVWKPNEVWLVAAAGVMVLAFPTAIAVAFSGFYLALMIVLWLLIGRGLGIELRHYLPDAMWRQFWDVIASASSLLLALCLGAALGNVVRGVPLNKDGVFFEALWTDFRVSDQTGILDWYTVLVGLVAVAALAHHGALWLSAATDGDVQQRTSRLASRLSGTLLVLLVVLDLASFVARPEFRDGLRARPWGAIFPVTAVCALAAAWAFRRIARPWPAYFASCVFLYASMATAAISIYPDMLPARNPIFALTVRQAAAPLSSLLTGLYWWIPGMLLVFGYFAFIHAKRAGQAWKPQVIYAEPAQGPPNA